MSGLSYRPFECLKELKVEEELHSPEVSTGENGSIDEEELFRMAMKGVKEIKEFSTIPYTSPKKAVPRHRGNRQERETLSILRGIVEGRVGIPLVNTQEYVEWVNPPYKGQIVRVLHEGRISVQDFIDLHGYTLQEAKEELREFILGAMKRGLSCVKVIHGRGLRSQGRPILKEAVLKWLERDFRKWIVAYVTARACDGGLGAIYVLLRSCREKSPQNQ